MTTLAILSFVAFTLLSLLKARDVARLRSLVTKAKRVEPAPGALASPVDMTVEHETTVGHVGIVVGQLLVTEKKDGIPKARLPTVLAFQGVPIVESQSDARGLAKVLDELAERLP
jgi:hypothetical protein